MGQVIQLQLHATPLQHARARMWHFMRRADFLRANGFTRAAAEAQRQEQIWEERAIELSRLSRRRQRPGLAAGPSMRPHDTGDSSRDSALADQPGNRFSGGHLVKLVKPARRMKAGDVA